MKKPVSNAMLAEGPREKMRGPCVSQKTTQAWTSLEERAQAMQKDVHVNRRELKREDLGFAGKRIV
jgi:hypothetical protein